MGDSFKAYREAFGPRETEYYSTQLNQRYFNVYNAFQEQGSRGYCDTCGQWKPKCISHLDSGSTECVDCCIRRLKDEAQRMLAGLDKPAPKPKPENKPEVDHIDRNPANNRVGNLRWATRSENSRNTKQHDRVESRGGTHRYEDYKQFCKEKIANYSKTHKFVRFSDGKRRWVTNEQAAELLKLPVKERVMKRA